MSSLFCKVKTANNQCLVVDPMFREIPTFVESAWSEAKIIYIKKKTEKVNEKGIKR